MAFMFAFRPSIQDIEITNTTAKVQSVQGLAVFIHSESVMSDKKLGTFSPAFVPSQDAKKIIEHMINKGIEKYPAAHGIICRDEQKTVADLVVFE